METAGSRVMDELRGSSGFSLSLRDKLQQSQQVPETIHGTKLFLYI